MHSGFCFGALSLALRLCDHVTTHLFYGDELMGKKQQCDVMINNINHQNVTDENRTQPNKNKNTWYVSYV